MKKDKYEILLVEDNPGDILLTQEAFSEVTVKNNLNVTEDGEAALDFLYKRNGYEDATTPDIILLDINLPKKNGFEVLDVVKSDAKLKSIPIIMLTSSESEKDIATCYALNANSYEQKPVNIEIYDDAIKNITQFWLNTALLAVKIIEN